MTFSFKNDYDSDQLEFLLKNLGDLEKITVNKKDDDVNNIIVKSTIKRNSYF